MITLSWDTEDGVRQRKELTGVLVAGRSLASDVCLPSTKVSSRHARFFKEGGVPHVQDLGSTNGTHVNGTPVTRTPLRDGDMIRLGPYILTVRVSEASADLGDDMFMPMDLGAPEVEERLGGGVAFVKGEEHVTTTSFCDADESSIWRALRQQVAAGTLTERRLRASYHVAQATATTLERDQMLDSVLGALFGIFEQAERGFILLKGESAEEEPLQCRAVRRRRGDPTEEITVSKTIIGHTMAERQSVLCADAAGDERFGGHQSIVDFSIRSMICAPLVFQDEVFGAIHIDTTDPAAQFSEDDLELLTSAASQVAMAVANARLHEERVKVQRLVAVGQTVAGLAHCIKNILNGIRGGSFVVDRGLEEDNAEFLRKGWDMVKRNNDFLSELVLDMLSFSKDRKPVYTRVDPNETCGEVCDLMKAKAAQTGIAITFEPDAGIGTVAMDSTGIKRCLLNLVSNALDACAARAAGESAPEDWAGRVVVRSAADPAQGEFEIAVQDNGCGIPEDKRAMLFQMFFSTKGAKGTGLGLAVSQKIVPGHHGDIHVESTVGEGTRFTIRLPVAPPEENAAENGTSLAAPVQSREEDPGPEDST